MQQQPVFVDVTAEWCITCKYNEKTAMSSDEFFEIAKEKNIMLVKGDFTSQPDNLTKFLKEHKRVSVPLYVIYVPGQDEPIYPPQSHSPETMINYFKQL